MNNPKNYPDAHKLVILADACSEVVYGGECGWERVDFDKFVEDVKKKLRGNPQPQAKPQESEVVNFFIDSFDLTFRFHKKGGYSFSVGIEGQSFTGEDSDTNELEEILRAFIWNLDPNEFPEFESTYEQFSNVSLEFEDLVLTLLPDEGSLTINIDTPDEVFESKDLNPENDRNHLTNSFLSLLAQINPDKYHSLWFDNPSV